MTIERTTEDVRRYWNRRPCNVRHSDAPIDSAAYVMETRDQKYRAEPHIRSFAQYDRWRGKVVLEIGCGIGVSTADFASNGAAVYAVDLSSASVNIARMRARRLHLDTITFLVADVEERLPKWWPHADLIYSFGVLHHTPDPEKALRRLQFQARRDTELRIMLYHRWSTKALALALRHPFARDRIARGSEAQAGCPITRTYTRRSAKRLLESAGWEVQSMNVDHIFRYRVAPYIEHRYETKTWIRLIGDRAFHMLERLLGWHLLIIATPR